MTHMSGFPESAGERVAGSCLSAKGAGGLPDEGMKCC